MRARPSSRRRSATLSTLRVQARGARARRLAARLARALTALTLAGLAAVWGGCADDLPPGCEASPLRYDNFGAPFLITWCRGCHSAQLPPEERQSAPIDVNFETRADAERWARRLLVRVRDTATMPPAGGPGEDERRLFGEWVACGAR